MHNYILHQIDFRSHILRLLLYPAIAARRLVLRRKHIIQNILLNNLSDLLQEDPVIKIDDFAGSFVLDSRSDLFRRLIINKHYESEFVHLILRYINPDRDALDIGANVGFYTIMLARILKQGKVISVEPTRNALKRLRRNLTINGLNQSVHIYDGVVSDSPGPRRIHTIEGKEEYSSLGEIVHPSALNEHSSVEEVNGITVDMLVRQTATHPGFMKVDVEGAEHLVFSGARETLLNDRPIILSELSDTLLKANGSSAESVIKIIKECNYDIFDPRAISSNLKIKDYGDILCFPREMCITPDKLKLT